MQKLLRWAALLALAVAAVALLRVQIFVVVSSADGELQTAGDVVDFGSKFALVTIGLESSVAPEAPKSREFGNAFGRGVEDNKKLLTDDFGRVWGSEADCNPCTENCIAKMQPPPGNTGDDVSSWGPIALQKLLESNFRIWNQSGFSLDNLVSMNSCAYKTRMRYNPHGLWLHISGRNVTTLRMMVDGYLRTKHIRQAIIDAVAASEGVFPPVSVYVSVTDIPCNTQLPYLTFFGKRGVSGIVIPDDSYYKGVQGLGWEKARGYFLSHSASIPFSSRKANIYFRGSPTHLDRTAVQVALNRSVPHFLDMKLAVMERFRNEQVPMEEIAQHRFTLAIRGKTASSRDKYLNLLGSGVVWVSEDEPWFQVSHVLWRPFYNFFPMRVATCECTARLLANPENGALIEAVARRGRAVGEFLTSSVVQRHLVDVLRRYAQMQTFHVPEDPIAFLVQVRQLVKKKYRWALVMPDDRNPVKFYFYQWLSRRVKQIHSCRTNNTFGHNQTLPPSSQHRCWYM
jgi:hypothetical protein